MSNTLWVSILLGFVMSCAKAGHNDQSDAPAAAADAPDPDGPNVGPDSNTCATQPCDILTQCGCGAMACDIDGTDLMGTACRTIFMPGHETATCANATRCDQGFVCLTMNNQGTCRKYCSSNTDCAAPRGQCVIDVNDGTGNPIVGIPSVCSSNCDPSNAAAGGCPAGDKCGLFSVTHLAVAHDVAICSVAGALVQGGNCKVGANGDDTLCGVDFLCTTVNAGTNFNCRRICNKTAGGGCGGLTCIGFAPAVTIGGTEYGVCN